MEKPAFNPGTIVFIDDESVTWFNFGELPGVGLEPSDPCIVLGVIDREALPTWISRSGFPCYALLSHLGVIYARQDGLTRTKNGI